MTSTIRSGSKVLTAMSDSDDNDEKEYMPPKQRKQAEYNSCLC